MTTRTPATAKIWKWLRKLVQFFTNFLLRLRIRKKNAESCRVDSGTPDPLPPPVGSRDSCFCNKIIHAWSRVAINYCGNCLLLPFHSQPPTVYMHVVFLEFLIGVSGLLLITLIFLVCLVYFLCKIMPSMLFFDDQFRLVVKISSQVLENPYLQK